MTGAAVPGPDPRPDPVVTEADRHRSGLNPGYLAKWTALGVAIGIAAGIGAVTFVLLLQFTTEVLLGRAGAYSLPTAISEGGQAGSVGFQRVWAIPLITTVGALLSAIVVAAVAPEAAGSGTGDAIEAVHSNPRGIRARVIWVKLIASSLTIGSGGSGGREGPATHMSAAFASLVCRRLRLSDADGRTVLAMAVGAGVGAIFNTPLGGAVLAASIIYREDIDYRSLVPGFIASGTAYGVRGPVLGFGPMFGFVAPEYRFDHAGSLLWFAVLGVAAASAGYAYARVFHGTVALTARLPGGTVLKPTIGGLLVGLLALTFPQVLSSGYGWIQLSMDSEVLLGIPLLVVLLAPAAKILATSLSIGTGGCGGLFGPGIAVGAFLGAAVWRFGDAVGLPGMPDGPDVFAVVAMMACFGSVAHAPLALLIMVAEMTGSFAVVPGAIITVGVASLLMSGSRVTMYPTQRLDASVHYRPDDPLDDPPDDPLDAAVRHPDRA